MSTGASLSEMRVISRKLISGKTGDLSVFEGGDLPIDKIERVFTISGVSAGDLRGMHAHHQCNQILFCLAGAVRLTGKDGNTEKRIELVAGGDGAFIPIGIWAEQIYLEDDSILLVICDQPYDETDYIRDWDMFVSYRRN